MTTIKFQEKETFKVNREQVCPFLLKTFLKEGQQHKLSDYTPRLPEENQILIHTWRDATLRELLSTLAKKNPLLAKRNIKVCFRLFYQDHLRPTSYQIKELGTLYNFKKTSEENKNLDEFRFVIGDYLDVFVSETTEVKRTFNSSDQNKSKDGGRASNNADTNHPPLRRFQGPERIGREINTTRDFGHSNFSRAGPPDRGVRDVGGRPTSYRGSARQNADPYPRPNDSWKRGVRDFRDN
ncbi:hypothetical protein HDU92_007565, partial [Lobulomyces angularis]